MKPKSCTVAASVLAGTVAYALALGVPMATITETTGLVWTDLVDPDVRLPNEHVATIWCLLRDRYPDRAIGVQIANVVPPSFFGPMAYAARYARNGREFLTVAVRYQAVLSEDLTIRLVETEAHIAIETFHPADPDANGLVAEAGLAIGYRFVREMTRSNTTIAWVEFSHSNNGPAAEYETFFGVPVYFCQKRNAMVFHKAEMDAPAPEADPRLYVAIQQHMDGISKTASGSSPADPVGRLYFAAAECAQRGQYGEADLAKQLGMSIRSLQRKAADHKLKVQHILAQTREARAHQLLSDRHLSVDDIAFLLGYSTEAAFRRAFLRWTGTTPAKARKGDLGQDVQDRKLMV
ncbi:MAG: AraC family transcriptional regulator [Myxococcales bacterium]|nr:AraC family transcriptional regulator [Myxococcales bacterium]